MIEEERRLCPNCNNPMAKAGKAWSGKNRVQRYMCNKCGKVSVKQTTDTAGKEVVGDVPDQSPLPTTTQSNSMKTETTTYCAVQANEDARPNNTSNGKSLADVRLENIIAKVTGGENATTQES